MTKQQTIGIIGGGQLGRMLTEAALPLGFQVLVVDPGQNCPAAQVGAAQIQADLYDTGALHELAERSDFITIEIEHLDVNVLDEIAKLGKPINAAPATIRLIQDKFAQKEFLAAHGVAVAQFADMPNEAAGLDSLKRFGGKMLVKTKRGAYDGRGNMVVNSEAELREAFALFQGKELYAESFVPFTKELAVMVARGMDGQVVAYPVTETIHKRNICIETLTPAAVDEAARQTAETLASRVAELLEGAGMFGIEMFLTADGRVLVNEIAPRVHNSGHYTMDACVTSQFEQHIRAISGMSLGSTDMTVPAAVMVNILGECDGETLVTGLAEAQAIPGITVYLYGKSPTKVDRKMGHINAVADTLDEARANAEKARSLISI